MASEVPSVLVPSTAVEGLLPCSPASRNRCLSARRHWVVKYFHRRLETVLSFGSGVEGSSGARAWRGLAPAYHWYSGNLLTVSTDLCLTSSRRSQSSSEASGSVATSSRSLFFASGVAAGRSSSASSSFSCSSRSSLFVRFCDGAACRDDCRRFLPPPHLRFSPSGPTDGALPFSGVVVSTTAACFATKEWIPTNGQVIDSVGINSGACTLGCQDAPVEAV